MQKLNAEADKTLRRIKEFTVREELKMGDDLGDSGTLPTTIADLLRRVLQKFGRSHCHWRISQLQRVVPVMVTACLLCRERRVPPGLYWRAGL